MQDTSKHKGPDMKWLGNRLGHLCATHAAEPTTRFDIKAEPSRFSVRRVPAVEPIDFDSQQHVYTL